MISLRGTKQSHLGYLNLEELSETFLIFGAMEDENGYVFDVPFDANGDFYGFIIKRK